MNKEIKKPLLVMREEFRNNLVNMINSYGLPIYVVEPILNEILNEVRSVLQIQYQKELQEYQKSLEDKDTDKE